MSYSELANDTLIAKYLFFGGFIMDNQRKRGISSYKGKAKDWIIKK